MLQTSQSDYSSILSEFLQTQVIIFGSQIVRSQLSDVKGIHYTPEGIVKKIEGDAQAVLEEVVKKLSSLSEFAVKVSLDSVVQSHTDTKPKPADLSHLPNKQNQLLNSIPLTPKSES
jgi:hypothetical protein